MGDGKYYRYDHLCWQLLHLGATEKGFLRDLQKNTDKILTLEQQICFLLVYRNINFTMKKVIRIIKVGSLIFCAIMFSGLLH